MYLKAVARGSEPANPVDRLVLLISKLLAFPSRAIVNMLHDVGLTQLLHSLQMGRYDFIEDKPASEQQQQNRNRTCAQILRQMDVRKPLEDGVRNREVAGSELIG